MDRHGENKTQRIYRCGSNNDLSKLIVDNRLDPDSPDFTHYDRSSGTRSRIERVYTDIKLLTIPRLIT